MIPKSRSGRREFLNQVGTAAAVGLAGGSGIAGGLLTSVTDAAGQSPFTTNRRADEAYRLREKAARQQRAIAPGDHPTNGDEFLYQTHLASHTKALPHNAQGFVDPLAYDELMRALTTGRADMFDRIRLGGTVRLANPQAAFAFSLEGADSHHLGMPAPPAFSSAEEAGEMAELYWLALTRDVPFAEYESDPLTNAAAEDLSRFSNFRGPKEGGRITPRTLFRGNTQGDLVGPYLSQFLLLNIPYGATPVVQRIRTTVPGDDYLTRHADWLGVQNGTPGGRNTFDSIARYIRNGRDLGEWDHRDFSYQGFLSAALILLAGPAAVGFASGGIGDTVGSVLATPGRLDAGNPYLAVTNQGAFSTFGPPDVLDLVARVANSGLKAVWYQKWLLHRRLRPEEFGGQVQNRLTGLTSVPIHAELLNAAAIIEVFRRQGTYLLSQAYPEGCPTHPAYPGGHSAIAGACTTILKAFFDESGVVANPVEASRDGLSLVPYRGPDLTVGGELNKLAANVALGRNTAGIHWRSDGIEGLKLGEQVAIRALMDLRLCYTERFEGFSLTKFDGTRVTV